MVVVSTKLENVLVVINTNLIFRNILAEFFSSIIAEAGRTRPELVEGDMVGQANNMFWLVMNELQDGDEGVDLGEVYGRWCGWYEGVVQQR